MSTTYAWLPIEQGTLFRYLPAEVVPMVLDLADGRKGEQWRLIDLLYDWDALDELPIKDDGAVYQAWACGWMRRSSVGAFSLSPYSLGQQTIPWSSVFAWVVQRKRQGAQAITVWRIRIASYIQEGMAQMDLSRDLATLREQLAALVEVADVELALEEMEVIKLRLGLINAAWLTLDQVARRLYVAQKRASYWQARALYRLRKQHHLKRVLQHYLTVAEAPAHIFKAFEALLPPSSEK
ncbi:MAG TPA: hypothetical protein VFV38_01720 [Ktedonobacteraceae bacterium]|nr:hypothetical protein [Ktedonobacteraceae bacterium]